MNFGSNYLLLPKIIAFFIDSFKAFQHVPPHHLINIDLSIITRENIKSDNCLYNNESVSVLLGNHSLLHNDEEY